MYPIWFTNRPFFKNRSLERVPTQAQCAYEILLLSGAYLPWSQHDVCLQCYKVFRFCNSKCHKSQKQHNLSKVRWTTHFSSTYTSQWIKASWKIEFTVGTSLLQFIMNRLKEKKNLQKPRTQEVKTSILWRVHLRGKGKELEGKMLQKLQYHKDIEDTS